MLIEGSDCFILHGGVKAAARESYRPEVVVPHTRYVTLVVSVEKCGRAHTGISIFQGRLECRRAARSRLGQVLFSGTNSGTEESVGARFLFSV